MDKNTHIRIANGLDAQKIKKLINKMYRSEYEKRKTCEIKKSIDEENELYSIVETDNKITGFCGVFINHKEKYKACIEYIYLPEKQRDLFTAYSCLMLVINKLIEKGILSAKLQVQTYNKQRFLHYAISDKNVIFEEELETNKGEKYKDQILLIKDLKSLSTLPLTTLLKKAYFYKKTDK